MRQFHLGMKAWGQKGIAVLLPLLVGSLLLAGCGKRDSEISATEESTAASAKEPSAGTTETKPDESEKDTGAVLPEVDPNHPDRYIKQIFESIDTEKDIVYAEAENYKGKKVTLKMDMYTPAGDQADSRPVIIWLHGGSLTGGSKDADRIQKLLAEDLAHTGYVSICPDYRIRQEMDNFSAALQDAMADTVEVIRWIEEHDEEYNLDKDKIAIGGYSSGGIISVNMCYGPMNKEVFDKEKIFGVINLAGGGLYAGPVVEDDPPCIIIQGTNDPQSSLPASKKLAKNLEEKGVYNVFYPIEGGGHDLTHEYNKILDLTTMFLYKGLTGKEILVDTSDVRSPEYNKVEERIQNNATCLAGQITLKLDGKLDEWESAEVILLNQIRGEGKDLPDKEDFQGTAMVGWNEQDPGKLYIAATVTDDIIQSNFDTVNKWYNNDCLEIAFDISKDNKLAPIFKCVVGANGASVSAQANGLNTEYVVVQEGNTYTYEIAIDLTRIDGVAEYDKDFSIRNGDCIGLSIAYNDGENGIGEIQIGWTPGKSSGRENFGNLQFVTK